MPKLETLPQHFLNTSQKYNAKKAAVRQKEFGIWREFSWQESLDEVRAFALGMLALGLDRGDRVATIGDNDREYYWGYLALQAAGGVPVGMFTDASPKEVSYIVGHSEARFVLAKDQEQVDKMLEVRESIPAVEKVIYWDDRGLWNYEDDWLLSFDEIKALGLDLHQKDPERFITEVERGNASDYATFCYTSGTTGLPKGAMLTHNNLVSSAELFDAVDPRYDTDNYVSMLPMGWIGEPALGVAPHCVQGVVVNFPESPETVQPNVREIAPEGVLYNSRLWDSLIGMVQVRMNDSTPVNRFLYNTFLPIGYKFADKILNKQSAGPLLKLQYWLGDLLVFSPLRDQMGFTNIRAGYTAGAALSPDAMRFFHALGVNLKQIYGSTEVCGGATIHENGDIKFASVGKPAPSIEVRIGERQEIQIAGPTVFAGYFKNDAATQDSIQTDADGKRWFCTGDAGYIDDDGHVIYLDRIKEMLMLSTGDEFAPQFIEGRLKFSPYIKDVMSLGGPDRDFVGALVIMDFENTGFWAEKRRIGYTTYADLAQRTEVYDLIKEVVAEVNSSLPETGRVKRFVVMHKEFDADDAEMTRSRKLRRNVLYDRYSAIVDAIYDGRDEIKVTTEVQYQDGSTNVMETGLRVMTLGAEA